MGMHTFEPHEAKRLLELSERIRRRSGLGDLIVRLETNDGQVTDGHIIEIDGEDSKDGILLGGMPPDNRHRFTPFDQIVWIGFGFLE